MASVIAKFNAETVINWFPGHMNKTVAKIRDTLKRVDTVIEVPLSSHNPMLTDLIRGSKRHIIVFTKQDLASPTINNRLIPYMRDKYDIRYGLLADLSTAWKHKQRQQLFDVINKANADVATRKQLEEDVANDRKRGRELKAKSKDMSPEELEQSENDLVAQREQDKRRREEAADKITRGPNKMSISLIVGLPNVGKSTLINQLIGRGTASVASVPGWTRGQQIYKLNTLNPADKKKHDPMMPPALRELTSQSTWLLDTPGVTLPHRLETEQGLKLALSGCIADHAIPDTYLTIGEYLYYVVTEQPFRHSPVKRDSSIIVDTSAEPETRQPTDAAVWYKHIGMTTPPKHYEAVLNHIGKRYGIRQPVEQAKMFVQMFREGKLGRYTLDYIQV